MVVKRTLVPLAFILWRLGQLAAAMVAGEGSSQKCRVSIYFSSLSYVLLLVPLLGGLLCGMVPSRPKSSMGRVAPCTCDITTTTGGLALPWIRVSMRGSTTTAAGLGVRCPDLASARWHPSRSCINTISGRHYAVPTAAHHGCPTVPTASARGASSARCRARISWRPCSRGPRWDHRPELWGLQQQRVQHADGNVAVLIGRRVWPKRYIRAHLPTALLWVRLFCSGWHAGTLRGSSSCPGSRKEESIWTQDSTGSLNVGGI